MRDGHTPRRQAVALAGGLLLTLALAATASAGAGWTSKPIRLVVGGTAGGNADVLARLLAEGLHQKLGQPVVVETKPGAAGVLAVNDLIGHGRDGSTFLVIQGGIVTETPLAYKVSYQPFEDLKPLAQLSRTGLVLVANKDLPVNDVKQLAAYGKQQADGLTFASYATGMRGHTSGMVLGQQMGVQMRHVGYKGSPQGLTDLMGGHIPVMMDGVTTSLPLIQAGSIKALAVNYPTRVAALPDVPTFRELGYQGLAEAGWFGVWSHPDAPAQAQQAIREISLQFLAQPQMQQKIRDMGMEPGGSATPEALQAELRASYQHQQQVLKSIDYQSQ